jgi:hypothetical protein
MIHDFEKKRAAPEPVAELSAYEKERQEKIAFNNAVMHEIGITAISTAKKTVTTEEISTPVIEVHDP